MTPSATALTRRSLRPRFLYAKPVTWLALEDAATFDCSTFDPPFAADQSSTVLQTLVVVAVVEDRYSPSN
jgi:hypothetical protein